jgi:hypothetical protein
MPSQDFFLKGSLSGTLILESAVEAKTDINFSAWLLHFGQKAGLLAWLMGRITSKTSRHLGQKYSYIAISVPPFLRIFVL